MLTHFTFCTYKNRSSLKEAELRQFLKRSFHEIAQNKGFKIINSEILEDHVHILIDHPLALSMSKVMQALKGISSRQFFTEYPSNRFVDRKLWARSYFYRKILQKDLKNIDNYIKDQRNEYEEDKRYSKSKK